MCLCVQHYQLVYHMKSVRESEEIACAVCGVKRKHIMSGTSGFMTCPEPSMCESYLRDTAGFSGSLKEGDMVCSTCYNFFPRLSKSPVCMLSSDYIISALRSKHAYLTELVNQFVCMTADSFVDLALHKTALHMCTGLINDRAFLFPSVYRIFLSYLPEKSFPDNCISKSRLLTYLGHEFGELLSSFCANRKVGAVFNRSKADMQKMLSQSLFFSHENVDSPPDHSDLLNRSVHHVISHMLNKSINCDQSMKLLLDVDNFISDVCSIAPELWEHICILTQSVNECKGRSAAIDEKSFAGQIKRLRRAYLVSLILFVTNSECNFPFHIVLSDAMETHGGSTELIRMFNRLGLVALSETLKRSIQLISHHRKRRWNKDFAC